MIIVKWVRFVLFCLALHPSAFGSFSLSVAHHQMQNGLLVGCIGAIKNELIFHSMSKFSIASNCQFVMNNRLKG